MSQPGSRTASPPRSAPRSAPKAAPPKKKRAPRPPPTHPPYVEMVRTAIASLKERGGSSRQKILAYITANYDVGKETGPINARLRNALRSGVEKGFLLHSKKGTGATGSFRVGKAIPKKKGKASPRKKGKSPRKKRAAKKKSPRKTAKRTTKKARKSPKKKAAKRRTGKKAAKRRSPKKKARPAARRPKAKGKARRWETILSPVFPNFPKALLRANHISRKRSFILSIYKNKTKPSFPFQAFFKNFFQYFKI